MLRWRRFGLVASLSLVFLGCAANPDAGAGADAGAELRPGKADDPNAAIVEVEPLNETAGDLIVYELQVRSANACRLSTGGADCARRSRPAFSYFGPGCALLDDLQDIRKSTLDDLLESHAAPNRTAGITLQYVDDVVGANTVWLMPIFPHNYRYNLPDACDDLGSPYAVRDYYHVRGTLADRCVAANRDEWSDPPCWADAELDTFIAEAHERGMRVMLDLAFNHLGHEYEFYDYVGARPVRDDIANGFDLWDFEATYDPALLHPEILDRANELPRDASGVVKNLCGDRTLSDAERVRRYLLWREGFDYERGAQSCERPATLENQLPGFYLGSNGRDPSSKVGDNYTNNWVDVKFLYNIEDNEAHTWEFYRTREFAFRVINYYLSRGVDAFRLDHANGLTENEWRYVFRKTRHYQALRGGPNPVFLSESFHNILELNRVFDVLTEGYHHDICHGTRDAAYIESKLFENRTNYLQDLSYVLLNLETHDEGRLLKSPTGFDIWRGATFYALAAASRGTLMLQVGQEWGEPWDLGFRRSDYLRGRFPWEDNWDERGDTLTALYRDIHRARLAPENVALRKGKVYFPRTDQGTRKDQLFAMVRYMPDCTNTLFTFFRLWVDDIETTYAVTDDLAGRICLADDARYRLVDALTGRDVWAESHPEGRTGAHIREFGLYVHLDLGTSFQWLRLERR